MIPRTLVTVATVFLSLLPSALRAQTVAFVGGDFTYTWQQSAAFQGHSNWQAYGFSVAPEIGPCHEVGAAVPVVQQIIASGKKPVIHLIVGESEVDGVSDSNPAGWQLTTFEECFSSLVTTIQQAKLKVLIGTIPFTAIYDVKPYNQFIFSYAAAHSIPVIDYYTLLHRAQTNLLGVQYYGAPGSDGWLPTVTSDGYSLASALAESAIAQNINGLKLKSGFLGNESLEPVEYPQPESGVNTVTLNTKMKWHAYGQYSDGVTRPIDNANSAGLYGTWWSTNPAVIQIDPDGTAYAVSPGTANIKFSTLSGVTLNEWTMYSNKFCIIAAGPSC